MPFGIVKRLNLARQSGSTKKMWRLTVLLRPNGGSYKKTTISDRQCTHNLIVHALTVANFTIDRPALLEINRKIVMMGGAILIVSKNRPLIVWCLSVFWGVLALQKIRSPTQKILAGRLGLNPLVYPVPTMFLSPCPAFPSLHCWSVNLRDMSTRLILSSWSAIVGGPYKKCHFSNSL